MICSISLNALPVELSRESSGLTAVPVAVPAKALLADGASGAAALALSADALDGPEEDREAGEDAEGVVTGREDPPRLPVGAEGDDERVDGLDGESSLPVRRDSSSSARRATSWLKGSIRRISISFTKPTSS